jgi:hypothetical protein
LAYPSIYGITYSYTAYQQSQQGVSSFPGTQLDADLVGLQASIANLATFVKGALRSDGALSNGSVTFDSLALALQANGTVTSNTTMGFFYGAGVDIQMPAALYDDDPASGYFANFNGRAGNRSVLTQAEVQPISESGGWRSAQAIYHNDGDTTNYQAINYRTISDGLRVACFGKNDGFGTYAANYKDVHGVTAAAIANTAWPTRGVAAFAGDAVQFGQGVCLNELTMSNPAGSTSQSGQIAGWYVTLSGKMGGADSTHTVHGAYIANVGKLATAGVEVTSAGTNGDSGQYNYLLKGDLATVAAAAIVMPASAAGNVGTYIQYAAGAFSQYDRAGSAFGWAIGGTVRAALNAANFYPAGNGTLTLGAASLGWAGLYMSSGAAINFNNGDVFVTHSVDALAFTGAASGYSFDAPVSISGSPAVKASDLGAWTGYTPTLSVSSGAFTTASATGAYRQIGKTVFFRAAITITTNGTAAGTLQFSLPAPANATFVFMGREDAVSGALLVAKSLGANASIFTAANAYPGGNGTVLIASGVYEAA